MSGALMALILQAAPAALPPAPTPQLRLVSPNWLQRPTAEQFSHYYPHEATRQLVAGKVVLACVIQTTGKMRDCRVASEQPTGFDFGRAGLELAVFFAADRADAGSEVRIPINFVLPGSYTTSIKRVRDPSFTEAKVTLDCRFIEAAIDNCVTRSVEPSGSEMEQVALRIVGRMDMAQQRSRFGRIIIPFEFTPKPLPKN